VLHLHHLFRSDKPTESIAEIENPLLLDLFPTLDAVVATLPLLETIELRRGKGGMRERERGDMEEGWTSFVSSLFVSERRTTSLR
jgi:hypothetical protein